MTLADGARRRYAQLYQAELNQELGSTLVDSLLERRAPMLLRLAMVFALTDRQWLIKDEHIEAAKAWVRQPQHAHHEPDAQQFLASVAGRTHHRRRHHGPAHARLAQHCTQRRVSARPGSTLIADTVPN